MPSFFGAAGFAFGTAAFLAWDGLASAVCALAGLAFCGTLLSAAWGAAFFTEAIPDSDGTVAFFV